jgi:hypothetical protein
LSTYAVQCLTSSFHDSGFALQDIVNQAGRRLGFKVEDGRYRGTVGEVGFDGIWWTAEGDAILAEVKTTDVYRLSLETTATYRRDLIKNGAIPEESSSILYVVGRSGTGESFVPVQFRDACITRLQSYFGESLVKQTAVGYATPNGDTGVLCAISKEHHRSNHIGYWSAFHPSQQAVLHKYPKAWVQCDTCGAVGPNQTSTEVSGFTTTPFCCLPMLGKLLVEYRQPAKRLPRPPPCDGGRQQSNHFTNCIPGGFHVPSPAGRIEGASVFGQ